LVKNTHGRTRQAAANRTVGSYNPLAAEQHSGDAKEGAGKAAPKPASHHKMNPYLDEVDIPANVYANARNHGARTQERPSARKDESPQRVYSTAADSGFAG
jgi:hypothetical protein